MTNPGPVARRLTSLTQLIDQLRRRLDEALRASGRGLRVATVSGTSGTQVIVILDGNTITVPRLASYTPTVGDTVYLDTVGDSWLVLGKTA